MAELKVIRTPKSAREEPPQIRRDPKVALLPPTTLSSAAALNELRSLLPLEVGEHIPSCLRFPPVVNFRKIPGGIEFYDTSSERPAPATDKETLGDIVPWVKEWYFSVFTANDRLTGRFIDKGYPGRKCEPFEEPLYEGKRPSLAHFIERIGYDGLEV
jgi:hypothetical protein